MAEPASVGTLNRVRTGNAQADEVLGGGFPEHSVTILMGHPGSGKTIFAEQLLFHNASEDRPALYLTTLSEPLSKVVTFLQGFDFFDAAKLGTSIIYDDASADLAEHGVHSLVERLRDAIKTVSPKLIVIDSFKVVHDLARSSAELRLLISELGQLLAAYSVTTFLVGEYSEEEIPKRPEFAMADGIVQLGRRPTSRRDERYMRVLKLRGTSYREGAHAIRLTASGIDVYPRLITPTVPPTYQPVMTRLASGIEGLDQLIGGGFWRGSNVLLIGAAGTGKTTFGLSFAAAGARSGEPSLHLNFQENPIQLARTIAGLGLDLAELERAGLVLRYLSPVELQIDSIVGDLFDTVRARGIRRVVIDSLSDLALASGNAERFHDYVYALVQHFSVSGVTGLMLLEGLKRGGGVFASRDEMRLSSVADGIITLGVEYGGTMPRRTIRVVKLRGTSHDLRPHDLVIHSNGLRIMEPTTP